MHLLIIPARIKKARQNTEYLGTCPKANVLNAAVGNYAKYPSVLPSCLRSLSALFLSFVFSYIVRPSTCTPVLRYGCRQQLLHVRHHGVDMGAHRVPHVQFRTLDKRHRRRRHSLLDVLGTGVCQMVARN